VRPARVERGVGKEVVNGVERESSVRMDDKGSEKGAVEIPDVDKF